MLFSAKFLTLLTLVCTSVLASPTFSSFVLHERRSHIPSGWSLSRRHDASAKLPLRLGLKQANIHNIEEFLMDISHPSSPNYGKHWDASKVAQTFSPTSETIDTVWDWLLDSGIPVDRIRLTSSKGWIEVDATIEEAENLMKTEYNVYSHDNTGRKHIACDEYHLPAHVAPHVEVVSPSVHFDAVIKKRSSSERKRRSSQPPNVPGNLGGPKLGPNSGKTIVNGPEAGPLTTCDEQITISCLQALYNISYTPVAGDINSYGIVEYTPEAYLQSDLNMFFAEYFPELVDKPPTEVDIDGGVQQTDDESFGFNGEPDLDLQYGMALVTNLQNVTLYQVGDLVEGASFNNFLDALDASYCTADGGDDASQDGIYPDTASGGFNGPEACGTVNITNVISTSYGYNEADLSRSYTARQCNEYAKLGLMGVTILYSSGDNGVAGNDGLCLNPDGSQTADGTIFNPSFPGGCPYVTSVGATQVSPGNSITDPESAAEQVIFSGGGFSNYFEIPSYQQAVVTEFLQNFSSSSFSTANFNASGTSRAFPDLAANGVNYVVAVDGEFQLVFGTSCSAPVTGAMITLINDARLAAGKSPVGFINPTIYSSDFTFLFNDITTGTNQGCGTTGFTAGPGWDPVTGLGTPNLGLFIDAFLALP